MPVVFMMLIYINTKSSVAHHEDFGKVKVGSINKIHMAGCNGILDTI